MDEQAKSERSAMVKERFRRAARKVKNYWIFTRRSSFEGFFASKSSAFALPDGDFARKASKNGGEMQMHLQSMVNLLRDDDVLRLVVKLEGASKERVRYLTVVSAFSEDDVEESIAMGVDWVNKRALCSIGMVLPLWRDTKIELDGDGGFILSANYRRHIIKPVSVQTMWTAVQWIHRCSENARKNNHFPNGLSHQWSNFYASHVTSDQSCVNEWYEMEDINSRLIQLPTGITPEEELMMKLIRHKLREVMMKVDLEEVTSRMIRESLEDEMKMDLKQYKQYIDEEMLTILGQMDSASHIYDHVYLGSEWNASNLEELRENGIGYVLNISREIDNFFSGTFEYYNIRVYDEDDSNLLPHWENTHKFINQARSKGVNVLVHCRMGMSRSASTVIAYGMKEYGLNLHDTMKHVKSKRSVINPNPGFWKQLVLYEGILNSSKQRFNPVFSGPGRRRTSSDDLDIRKGIKRKRNRRDQKFNTVTIGEKLSSEPILEDEHAATLPKSTFVIGEDADDEGEDEDDGQNSSGEVVQRILSPDDVLRTWELSNIESSSLSSSVDHDMNEIEDTVGVLGKPQKSVRSKVPELHRAKSVPSLRAKNSDLSITIDESKPAEVELHRCTSLHEFLSGKVRKLKEDFKAQSLDRPTRTFGSIERRSTSHPTSPVGEENKENIDETNTKKKLHSTRSDPTCILSTSTTSPEKQDEKAIEEGQEKEDKGSIPDQAHNTIHHDAKGVVKSGTVKRQSRNFEEGKVNLPWEWEEALDVLKRSEEESKIEDTPDSPSKTSEVPPSSEDEPPVGVVKMHAQKFQESVENDGKSAGQDTNSAEIETQGSPKQEESHDSGEKDLLEVGCTQKARELFEKDIEKVNLDMLKEKSKRRLGQYSGSSENIKTQETIETVETQESEVTSDQNLDRENSVSEDPLPGTVRKHTQAIEDKYQQLLKCSSVESFEDLSNKHPEADTIVNSPSKTKTGIEDGKTVSEAPEDTELFDVDVLLQRVQEDMRKEMEEGRETEGFQNYHGFSLEESMFEDIRPKSENTDIFQEQDDESEIPRPGTVKRNTELLLGKGPNSPNTSEKKSTLKDDTVVDNADHSGLEVSSKGPPSPEKNEKKPESPKKSTIQDPENESAKGLVKRNTLVYEGVIPFSTDDNATADVQIVSAVDQSETKNAVEEVKDDSETDGKTCSGTVKRNTLIFERKVPSDEDGEAPKSTSTEDLVDPLKIEIVQLADQENEPNVAETSQDAVDTSSVVNVKLHLSLLEEVIRSANERENHKQRTTKALAALERKRKQIEMEQTKLDFESSKEPVVGSSTVKTIAGETTVKVSDEEGNTVDANKNDSNEEMSPCVGNVRLRTLQLEVRINETGDDNAKSVQPLRRHGSMPRTTRPIDRPVVRQRSMSDLQVGSHPSTSRVPVASTSKIVRHGRTDKNKQPKLEEDEGEPVDNDRDSEKSSDDRSPQKSDQVDDDLNSKSVVIFDLNDQNTKANSKENQIPQKDNKDL